MTFIKKIVTLAVSILMLGACKNGNVEQSQSDDSPVIVFPQTHSYDITTNQTSDTIIISQQPKTNAATTHSHGSSNRRYHNSKKEVNRHGYAERKKTDELEEEYYDVFGKDYLYHIDDEEYEAGEDEYDYDD